MQELRFVAVSEDGSYAVLAIPGRSGRYILPIDERLRAVALGQTSRLAQYEIEVESPLRPKEIQARIRAGETAEEIADAAGIPVERVRWFEGPVLAERAYIADQAQSGSVRRAGDSAGPGPRLGGIVTERLSAAGTDPADGQWDSRKRGDGNWQVSLTFPSGGRLHVAEWVFDPRRRHVMPDDDNAARLSLPESDLPAEPVPVPGEATVTPIASRLGAVAGMGGGGVSAPGVSRFRPDRSVIPDRSLGADRSLAERPAAMPDRGAAGLADRTAAPAAPAAPRPGQQDRAPNPGRSAHPGYAEFPESAPYRAPEPAAEPADRREPRGYGDPASLPAAFRAPAAEPPARRDHEDATAMPSAYRAVAEPPTREPAPEPRGYRDPLGFRVPVTDPLAHGERGNEPVPGPGQADEVPAAGQPERVPVNPPRPVVFEDPGSAFPDEEPEVTAQLPPEPSAPGGAGATPGPAAPAEPARPAPAPPRAPVEEPRAAAAPASPAAAAAAEPAGPTGAPLPEAGTRETAAVRAAPTAVPAAPDPGVAGQAGASAAAVPRPDAAGDRVTPPAGTAPSAVAATHGEAAARPGPVSPEEPPGAPEEPAAGAPEPAAEPTAAAPGTAAAEPGAPVPGPPDPESAAGSPEGQSARRSGKKNAKARRSSVPSWDEIMLGSSRQRD